MMRQLCYKEIMALDKKKIPLDIQKAICLGLQSWLTGSTRNFEEILSKFSRNIQQAFQHQSEIGWDHFVRGSILLTWGTFINDNFANQHYDAEAWGTKLIDINFEHLLLFWEHRCQNEYGVNRVPNKKKS